MYSIEYSASKRRGILLHATTQMNLEDATLKQPSAKEQILWGSTYFRLDKFIEAEIKTEATRAVKRGWEFLFNGLRVSFRDDEKFQK